MKWKNFEESKVELPESTVEKMIEGFSAATKDLVQLGIQPKSNLLMLTNNKLGTKFQFEVLLLSKFLPDYSFTVFEFGYNVILYPVKVYFSKAIFEEISKFGDLNRQIVEFEEEAKFQKAVELIFETKKFIDTVSGLMKIAAKKDIVI